jgi:hypothetical protein
VNDAETRAKKAAYQRAWRAKHGARTGRRGPALSATCGTRSGYHRHYKEGTAPCVACREANSVYRKALKARKG